MIEHGDTRAPSRTHRTRWNAATTHTPAQRLYRRLMRSGTLAVTARLLALGALFLPTLAIGAAQAASPAQAADEQDITDASGALIGRYFRETGGDTGLGFDVREPFYSAFQALGGATVAGYPVSIPFTAPDGCTYQAFQVALLQTCASGPVQRANTFQIMEQAGVDTQLEQKGIGRGESDNATSFDQAKQIRLGWLEDPAIRDAYLTQCGSGDAETAIQLCGLPMNHPRQIPPYPFISQRFQRIAFQRCLAEGPGCTRAGEITRSLGSDLLKETGVLTGPAVQPQPLGQVPPPPVVTFGAAGVAMPGNPQAQPTAQATAQAQGTTTPATSGTRTQPLNYGFQGDFFSTQRRPQAINLIKDAGFGWAKQQIVWDQYELDPSTCPVSNINCQVEIINGRTHYFKKDQLGFLDAVMNDLSASGLNILASVVRAPSFIAAPGGAAPANPDMLRDFVQFLATRYKGKIKAMEPWNEQNLSWEWGSSRLWPNAPAAPPQGAIDFVNQQRAAYQGIKAADPTIIVILPAGTPTGLAQCWEDQGARNTSGCLDQMKTAIDDRLYLDFVYQVNNGEVKNYYDVVGVHPSGYNNPPDDWTDKQSPGAGNGFKGHGSFYIKRYQELRAVQQKYGDSKPMWFTEVGWSATTTVIPGYEYGQDNTEAERGQYFGRLLEQIKNEAPYVTNVIVWNLNFRTLVGATDEKYGFGVVDSSGNPLPAYTCLKDFVRSGERITLPQCRP